MSESKPGDAQGPLECGPALRDRFCVLSLLETLLEASFRRRKAVPQGGTALQTVYYSKHLTLRAALLLFS